MMDTSTIDRHRCPRCSGHGTNWTGTPPGRRNIPCALCGATGEIDDATMARVEAGRKEADRG